MGFTQAPIKWVQGAKRPEREADNSLPPSDKVKNEAIPPFPYT
jgi:hypothetical protein